MSSIVAFQGVPFAAAYAASKAYIQSLAEALAREGRSRGIDLPYAAPGPVASGFGNRAGMQMPQTLTAEKVAMAIVKSIGRKRFVLPGALTKFLTFNLALVPRWAKVRIMQQVMLGFIKHRR